jgi:hypothetical protein
MTWEIIISSNQKLWLQGQPAWEGEPAAVVGFPLMSPYRGFGPIVTAGNVVRVVREGASADSSPLMLLTSAGVHAGMALHIP